MFSFCSLKSSPANFGLGEENGAINDLPSDSEGEGRRKSKGNMNVDIAVEAMELAPYVGHIVLFSGDGDFRAAVEAVQRRGVRVTVISSIASQPPIFATTAAICGTKWGSEREQRSLHTGEVIGSIPIAPTISTSIL